MGKKTATSGEPEHNPALELTSLLAEHRHLALTRGPIGRRAAVLRQLLELKPGFEGWRHDLAAYEAERLKEIEVEANQALTLVNLHTLEELRKELRQFASRKRNAERVLLEVEQYHRDVKLKILGYDLEDEERNLFEAGQRKDFAEAKRRRDRCVELARMAKALLEEAIRDAETRRRDPRVVQAYRERLSEIVELIQRLAGG